MAETAPKSRLEQFNENKAAQEQATWEKEVYGDAGVSDFSDEAWTRVQEGNAYERQMKMLAEREGESENTAWSRNFEQDAERNQLKQEQLRQDEDQRRRDEDEALREKFTGSALVRHMEPISKDIEGLKAEVAKLRNEAVDADASDEQIHALEQKEELLRHQENRLTNLLVKYSESPDYDEEIERFLIDREDPALNEATTRVLGGRKEAAPQEIEEEDETVQRKREIEEGLSPEPAPAPTETPARSPEPEAKPADNAEKPAETSARLEEIRRSLEQPDEDRVNERLDSLEQRLAERDSRIEKLLEQMATMQGQMQQMFESMQASGIAQAERNDNPTPTADNDGTIRINRISSREARKAKKAANKNTQPERRGSSEKKGKFKGFWDFIQFRGSAWEKIGSLKDRRKAKVGAGAIYHNGAETTAARAASNREAHARQAARARTQESIDTWYANPANQ
jgi:hypothetical protein